MSTYVKKLLKEYNTIADKIKELEQKHYDIGNSINKYRQKEILRLNLLKDTPWNVEIEYNVIRLTTCKHNISKFLNFINDNKGVFYSFEVSDSYELFVNDKNCIIKCYDAKTFFNFIRIYKIKITSLPKEYIKKQLKYFKELNKLT